MKKVEYEKRIKKKFPEDRYTLISETKVLLLKHNLCGFVWFVQPGDVLNGKIKCPKCRK